MLKKTRKFIRSLSYQHPQASEDFERYMRSTSRGAYFIRKCLNSIYLLRAKNRLPKNQEHSEYVQRLLDFNNKHMVIVAHEHVAVVANLIRDNLKRIGISSEITDHPPEGGFTDAVHIVICPQAFHALPRNYIAFQMEQLAISDRYRNKRYLDILCGALAVVDYSLSNCEYMIKNGVPKERVFYLPIFSKIKEPHDNNLVYDVLFYGDIHSTRRQKLLNQLKKDFNLRIAFKVWGEKKFEELKKAKIIVNLHFYEDALLETTRIFECLQLGKIVVSEEGYDQDTYSHLDGIVKFVKPGDYENLKQTLQDLLSSDHLQTQLQLIQTKIEEQPDWFAFYFYRVLLALDIISFDTFYDLVGKDIQISEDTIFKISEFEPISKEVSSLTNSGKFAESLRHYLPEQAEKLTKKLITRKLSSQNDLVKLENCTTSTRNYWR